MPFKKKFESLLLSSEEVLKLKRISNSRKESVDKVKRAKVLFSYNEGTSISFIRKSFNISYNALSRCINKALSMGIDVALKDLPRSGRPRDIPDEERAWIISLACLKPKDLGYASELWTQQALAKHIRRHCKEQGYPALSKISKGTVCKILKENDLKPHKISYYLERRDPDFDQKMAEVLLTYKKVELQKQRIENGGKEKFVTISCDEKPGIQAIANIAPDLPPLPLKHASISRDYEYKRLGTVSLLAGMDLHDAHMFAIVRDRHRSREFIELLHEIDEYYPEDLKIRLILDNHSSHISKETKTWLSQHPNRFDFVFTPTHASWLNIIETLFSKMARTFLRGIRVQSKDELKKRIVKWIEETNSESVVFKWKYQPEKVLT